MRGTASARGEPRRYVLRRRAALRAVCVALALVILGCAGRQPVKPGVSRVNKPIMRRGSALEKDITNFLRAGYLLLEAEARFEETFKDAAGEATKEGRGFGAHMIVVYEGLKPEELNAATPPVFMAEPPFSSERFAQELRELTPSQYTIFYWSRPNTPLPLGIYFHPTLPAETREQIGDLPAVQIRAVIRGSPASLGYLLNDDVVTHVDGTPVTDDPSALIASLVPKRGERVTFTVLREGDSQDKVVALYP